MSESGKTKVLVAGATGYAGALAAELVWRHPNLELAGATSRSEIGTRLTDLYPRYRTPIELTELNLDSLEEGIEAAIVCYPHVAAAPVVAEMRGLGLTVVDLSADFRLVDAAIYERWYAPHGEPELLDNAVYGLTELDRDRIKTAELVANPGCYPTAALLALAPLAELGLIKSVVIDAKSGVSGAGRDGGERLSLVNMTENFQPYAANGHRHLPEIEQELARLGGQTPSQLPVTFIPHLLPIDQGLLATCYVEGSGPLKNVGGIFAERYADEAFVQVVDSPPGLRDVRDTNVCRIHAASLGDDRVVVFAAIDNLWKGAAGQAIQNLNLMLGLDEGAGL